MKIPEHLADGRPLHATRDSPTGVGIEYLMTREDAFELVARAKGKTPADWLSWMHLGTALHIVGDSEEGLRCTRKAVELYRSPTTLLDLAVILESFGQFDEAIELAKEGNALDPTNQFVGLLYAQARLRQGQWYEAWPDFEKYCWGRIWELGLERYIPQWQGQSLENKRILVLQGGGFGDNLMFMRWFRNLKSWKGCHLTYACPDVMVPLLQGHPWIDRLLPTHEDESTGELPEVDLDIVKDGVRQFDYFAPIMGLAKRCGATVANTEETSRLGPYINVSVPKIHWNGRPQVGVCWMGAEKLDPRRHRSLDLEQAARLLSVDTVRWVNLQYGMTPPAYDVYCPKITNWKDTAEIIANLDLVVTVDTGVAHLAGAMGKKTLVIIPGLSDWKFLLSRDDMVFYPSVRLFRNKGIGLDNALNSCIEAVQQFV